MKASELRIGNLVLANHKGDIISMVDYISTEAVNVLFERQEDLCNGLIVSPERLMGVPLTEEWLLKFGFKQDASDDAFVKGNCAIFLDRRYKINFHYKYDKGQADWCRLNIKVWHVHQLQNLFFCLCGEELTTN